MELKVLKIDGTESGKTVVLDEKVFGIEPNDHAIYLDVVQYLANQRQGTSATKTRAMVRGGGKKPWKQKGTGHARVGSTRSPLWVGGGTTFGPQPRSYAKAMTRKARRLALRCALSAKVAAGELVVVDNLAFDDPKTKRTVEMLAAFNSSDAKNLIITDGENENVELSARNMRKVTVINNGGLNCFDLLHNHKVFLDKNAVAKIEEVLA